MMLHVFVLISEAQQGSSTRFGHASDGTACFIPTDAAVVLLHVLLSMHVCLPLLSTFLSALN